MAVYGNRVLYTPWFCALTAFVTLTSATGCAKHEKAVEKRPVRATQSPIPEGVGSAKGPTGELLPSGNKVWGLELPRGLHFVRSTDDRQVFTTVLDLTSVKTYFGRALTTAEIIQDRQRTVFRNARVRDAGPDDKTRLTVSIAPSSSTGGLRIELQLLTPPRRTRVPEEKLREDLLHERKHLD